MSMRKWIIILNLLLLGSRLEAVEIEDRLTESLGVSIGKLRFSASVKDAGTVQQGQNLLFQFPYEVGSSGDVTILGLHQQCGCITQSFTAGQVLPAGTKGILNIRVDTRLFTGSFDKTVTFLTNSEDPSVHVLRLKARIDRVLLIRPPLVEMDLNKVGRPQVAMVRIERTSKQSLHIEKVVYNEDTFDVKYLPVEGAWELQITWKGEAKKKPWFEFIEVTTDSSVKVVKIPVVGTATPGRLDL